MRLSFLARFACVAPLPLLAVAACSTPAPPSDGGADARADVAHDAPPTDATDVAADGPHTNPGPYGLTARFALVAGGALPDPFEIPFPSDLYRGTDGHVVSTLSHYTTIHVPRSGSFLATALANLDGFGLNTGAMFVIDSNTPMDTDPAYVVDPNTLPATAAASLAPDATAFMLDLDPTATPDTARVPCVAGWQPAFRTITVQPENTVLLPGRRYAVVITTGIQGAGATVPVAASPIFAAIRDNAPNARSGAAGMLYGEAVDRVMTLLPADFDRTRIAALAVFTTQTTPRQLRPARDALQGTTAPTLNTDAAAAGAFHVVRFGAHSHAGWTATLDAWLGAAPQHNGQDIPGFPATASEGLAHDAIGAVLSGTFVAPNYQRADGSIAFDAATGAATVVDANTVLPVTLALPNATACPVPANGYPVAIFGHGLGGQRREMMGVANEFARACIATAAIDHVTFGQRADPTDTTTLEHGTYRGPDGFGDSPSYDVFNFFGTLTNLLKFRDNIRQDVLDLAQLRRLLANHPDLGFVADEYAAAAPRIDGAHVAYVGNSLGGIIGTVFAGAEPEVNPFVLNVAGGAWATRLATDSPAESALLATAYTTIFGAPTAAPVDRFHPLGNLIQMIADGADPTAFAADITHPSAGRPHDVWLTEALWDETVPNTSSTLLAHVLGLPQINPVALPLDGLTAIDPPVAGNLAMGAAGGFLQEVPACHGSNLTNRYGTHRFEPPFPRASGMRFVALAHSYQIRESLAAYQRNIARFFNTGFAGSASIDVTGMTPLLDQDDDGWTDAEEQAMETNPYDPTSHPSGTAPHTRDVGFDPGQ